MGIDSVISKLKESGLTPFSRDDEIKQVFKPVSSPKAAWREVEQIRRADKVKIDRDLVVDILDRLWDKGWGYDVVTYNECWALRDPSGAGAGVYCLFDEAPIQKIFKIYKEVYNYENNRG